MKSQTHLKIKLFQKQNEIDANSLLTNVEKELDETHKETTLEKLTKKFQDAKSALSAIEITNKQKSSLIKNQTVMQKIILYTIVIVFSLLTKAVYARKNF